eukprot:1005120-Pleurochrysis_carterae.AAC.1
MHHGTTDRAHRGKIYLVEGIVEKAIVRYSYCPFANESLRPATTVTVIATLITAKVFHRAKVDRRWHRLICSRVNQR